MVDRKKASLVLFIAWSLVFLLLKAQLETIDDRGTCGPDSLEAAIRAIRGGEKDTRIAGQFAAQRSPTTLGELAAVARAAGYRANCQRLTLAELQKQRPVGVLHVDNGHFVALIVVTASGVEVIDPMFAEKYSRQFWTNSDLTVRWAGSVLTLAR